MRRDASLSEINHQFVRPTSDVSSLIKLKLSPLNRAVFQVSELLRNPYATTKRIAEAVASDQIFAARLVKMANSSVYAGRKKTGSIHHAIESIGMTAFYDVVMMVAFADGFAKEIATSVFGRIIWEHSVTVALLAREISEILKLRGTDEAFVCGLLHDVGKILILRAESKRFEWLLENKAGQLLPMDEEEAFGMTHPEVSAFIAHRWLLPAVVGGIIRNHHKPQFIEADYAVIGHLVNVADALANARGYGLRAVTEEELLRSESFAILNLNHGQILSAWERIQPALTEIFEIFS